MRTHGLSVPFWQRAWTGAALLAFGLLGGAAAADVIHIDPASPPASTLPPEEAQRLATLQRAAFPPLITEVSPDDRNVLTISPTAGPAVMNVRSGALTPVALDTHGLLLVSEVRWRDAQTLVAIGATPDFSTFHEVILPLAGGGTTRPLALNGFPISLSPRGRRVLIARVAAAGPEAARLPLPRVREVARPSFRRAGPAVFDVDTRLRVQAVSINFRLAVVDLAGGAERVLGDFSAEEGLSGLSWSPGENRLALVHGLFPDFTRGGVVPPDSPTVQDGLGRLAPQANPFFTSNALEIFDLGGSGVQRRTLRPGAPGGPIFVLADWSSDGDSLVALMGRPSRPRGRTHPSYGNINASAFRFYSARGRLQATLDRPEIDSPFSLPLFVSDRQLVIHTVQGTSFRLFQFDLQTRRLRRLPTESGAIYQVRRTNHTRELVYNQGSVRRPYEIHRVGLDSDRARTLTHINAAVAAANRVRVDGLRFHLGHRGSRAGFLIQPAGADFPPHNQPIVVWQQGGPNGPMTDDWGGFVEQPFNLLPNFGFAMLVVPLEGRWGFGPERFDALADGRNFGQIDIDEQAQIVAQLVARGFTSPDRVGVTGCSYGGYFASQSITRRPSVYAAANAQCSLLDLFNEWNTGYTGFVGYLEGRALDEDPDEYRRDSPVFNAARVKTPTLLFAGTEDFLPWEISLAFHDGIEAAGTDARFLVFAGEPHGLRQPTSQFVAGEAQLLWFRRHLNRD